MHGATSPPPCWRALRGAAADQLPPSRRTAATGERRAGRGVRPAALARGGGEPAQRPGRGADTSPGSERKLVQIVTIHKSKGLEYPLVLPFICSHRRRRHPPLFHEAGGGQSHRARSHRRRGAPWPRPTRSARRRPQACSYVALTRGSMPPGSGWRRCGQGRASRRRPTCTAPPSATCCKGGGGDAGTLATALTDLAQALPGWPSVSPRTARPLLPAEAGEAVGSPLCAHVPGGSLSGTGGSAPTGGWRPRATATARVLANPGFDDEVATRGCRHRAGKEACSFHLHLPEGACPGTLLHSLFETIDPEHAGASRWQ